MCPFNTPWIDTLALICLLTQTIRLSVSAHLRMLLFVCYLQSYALVEMLEMGNG